MDNWIVPYITFNGNCEEAVKFYQKVFGGETQILRMGDAPANPQFPIPEEQKNLVMHAELKLNGHILRFSDNFTNEPATGNNISFTIEFATEDETLSTFEALSEGGNVEMAPQKTFFSPLYCKFTDKFGIIWQLICKA